MYKLTWVRLADDCEGVYVNDDLAYQEDMINFVEAMMSITKQYGTPITIESFKRIDLGELEIDPAEDFGYEFPLHLTDVLDYIKDRRDVK